jgi:large repetitive protein
VVIDVLANDFDPDGIDTLTLTDVRKTGGSGSVERVDGGVRMAPNPDFVGVLEGVYTVTDDAGATATARVTYTVNAPANRAPAAESDSVRVPNGGFVRRNVLDNDEDPDGDPLIVTLESRPSSSLGEFTWNNGTFTFAGRPGAAGSTSFEYSVSDGKLSQTVLVLIEVLACSESQPVAVETTISTGYQQPVQINLADYSSGGDIINVAGVIDSPSEVYTPPAGENGVVEVTYSVRNGCGITVPGRLLIDVNQNPSPATLPVPLSAGGNATITVDQLASDEEPLTISSIAGNPPWARRDSATAISLSPPRSARGSFTFTVVVADPGGLTATATVTVEVGNQPPVANADAARGAGGTLTIPLLANDSDPESNPISLQSVPASVSFSGGGSAAITTSGDSVVINVDDVHGVGVFNYTIADSVGNISAPAAVTVVVNEAPQATNRDITIDGGTVGVAAIFPTDPDGDALSVQMVDDPFGWVTSITLTEVTITVPTDAAAGAVALVYQVTDTFGETARGTITVTVPDPPDPTGPPNT